MCIQSANLSIRTADTVFSTYSRYSVQYVQPIQCSVRTADTVFSTYSRYSIQYVQPIQYSVRTADTVFSTYSRYSIQYVHTYIVIRKQNNMKNNVPFCNHNRSNSDRETGNFLSRVV